MQKADEILRRLQIDLLYLVEAEELQESLRRR